MFIGEMTSPSIGVHENKEYTAYSKVSLDIICAEDKRLPANDQEKIFIGETNFLNTKETYCIPGTPSTNTRDLSSTYPLTQGQKTITIQYEDAGGNASKTFSQNIIYDTITPILSYTGLSTTLNQRNISTGDAQSISGYLEIQEANLQNVVRNTNTGTSSLYDPSLIIMYNFDQQTLLGESTSLIKDFSLSQNDAQTQGAL
jgi:hypothetical protein